MKNYNLILYPDTTPDKIEWRVARLLTEFFRSDIEFVPRSGLRSPDLNICRLSQLWEIKCPRGNSKNTIHHNLSGGKDQSQNIVIALYRTKMTPARAIGYIKRELNMTSRLKQVILITKQDKILVFRRKR